MSKNYLQVCGKAMETKLAPSYANIFMDYFEEKYVYTYPNFQCVKWTRLYSVFGGDQMQIWMHSQCI